MKPQFQALVSNDPVVAKVFLAALHRRPWSHRHPTWTDPRFLVATPRLPTGADHKADWATATAPRTLGPDPQAVQDSLRVVAATSEGGVASEAAAEAAEAGDAFDDEEDPEEAAKKKRRAARRAARRADARKALDEEAAKEAPPALSPGEATKAAAAARAAEAARQLLYFSRHVGNESALAELRRVSSGGLGRHVLVHGACGSGKRAAAGLLVRKTVAAQLASAEGRPPEDGLDTDEERAAMDK
jgi:hypothetical protein